MTCSMTQPTAHRVQLTLTGEQTDRERERPATLRWCAETEEWVLRSRRFEWDHPLYDNPESVPDNDSSTSSTDHGDTEEDDEDEPREVGGVFTVELSYDVTFRKEVIAADEEQATTLAKERLDFRDDCPADAIPLHDEAYKHETLTEDDDRCDEMPGWPW